MWKELREFTFPARLISTIESSEIEDGLHPTTVGAVRLLKWRTGDTTLALLFYDILIFCLGEMRKQRLLELSDQHYRAVWEIVEGMSNNTRIITSMT